MKDLQLQRREQLDDEPLRPKSCCGFSGTERATLKRIARRISSTAGKTELGLTRLNGRIWRALIVLMLPVVTLGCKSREPVAPEVRITNYRFSGMAIAVAPAVNLSGSAAFDPERFADLMASELQYASGVSVLPVSRVLAVLASQGRSGVESPVHAQDIAEALGADAILVFAVTDYDPYSPPSIGITAQLYGARPGKGGEQVGPTRPPSDGAGGTMPAANAQVRLLAQTQRIFNASHDSVVAEIRAYGSRRDSGGSPYGWRRYLVSQQDFIRFCCFSTIESLLSQ